MSQTFDVCIVGLGPAGLGAAIRLATIPNIRLLCVDSGPAPQIRYCSVLDNDPCRWARPCEMISGLGGAALLSGGKLSLYPAGRGMSPLVGGNTKTRAILSDALNVFRKYVPLIPPTASTTSITAAARDFRNSGFHFRHYDSYRYNRSDLVDGFRQMSDYVRTRGHDIRLLTAVEDIVPSGTHFSITLRSGDTTQTVSASRLVLATGRSGTPLLSRLPDDFPPVRHLGRYDVGVRLEFPYECWQEIDRGHNDLKLEFGQARTFCVCTNGALAPYRVNNNFLLEGYSEAETATGLTNLGIVVRVLNDDPGFFDNILHRVATISGGRPIRESLVSYLGVSSDRPSNPKSSIAFWKPGSVSMSYPADIADRISAAVHRFSSAFLPRHEWHRAAVFGPEIDYYWPTIAVRPDFRTSMDRLFVIGDATTRFRGILQAFGSGLHTASIVGEDIRRGA